MECLTASNRTSPPRRRSPRRDAGTGTSTASGCVWHSGNNPARNQSMIRRSASRRSSSFQSMMVRRTGPEKLKFVHTSRPIECHRGIATKDAQLAHHTSPGVRQPAHCVGAKHCERTENMRAVCADPLTVTNGRNWEQYPIRRRTNVRLGTPTVVLLDRQPPCWRQAPPLG